MVLYYLESKTPLSIWHRFHKGLRTCLFLLDASGARGLGDEIRVRLRLFVLFELLLRHALGVADHLVARIRSMNDRLMIIN